MRKIEETLNYHIFEVSTFNRDVRDTRALEASMKKYGWLDACPMFVFHNGRKLEIKDGHRRFETAQKLGIPAKYIVVDRNQAEIPIIDLQITGKPWDMSDFLNSNVRLGKPEYIKVKEFHEETGISVSLCISLLAGDSAGSANHGPKFKYGGYKLGDQSHAGAVADVVMQIKKVGAPFASSSRMVVAISKVLRVNEVDISTLKQKIASHRYLLEPQRAVDGYIEMLEQIYNRQSKDKLPIKFLADEKAKERNAVVGGNVAKAIKKSTKKQVHTPKFAALSRVFRSRLAG